MSKHHNPEKRAWRGRSYKKGGERINDLRAQQKHNCPDCGQDYEEEHMTQQADEHGAPEWVCDACSNYRDRGVIR